MDPDVLTEADLAAYAAALERNGFFGPDSWYMNHDRNAAYSAKAINGGRLNMPVLFLHAANDLVCDTSGIPSFFEVPRNKRIKMGGKPFEKNRKEAIIRA